MKIYTMIVYMARNKINNKVYIGKTIGELEQRKKEHYYQSKAKTGSYFQSAIRKHGIDNFEWSILCECNNNEELNQKEIDLIKHFKSQDNRIGYNITSGGEISDVLRWHPKRKEIIEKIRQSNLKRNLKNRGKTYEELYGEERGKRLRKIRSETNIMNKQTVYECWVEKHGDEIADQILKEQSEKISRTHRERKVNVKPEIESNKKQEILNLWSNQDGLTVTEISRKTKISRFLIKKFLNSAGYSGYGLALPSGA